MTCGRGAGRARAAGSAAGPGKGSPSGGTAAPDRHAARGEAWLPAPPPSPALALPQPCTSPWHLEPRLTDPRMTFNAGGRRYKLHRASTSSMRSPACWTATCANCTRWRLRYPHARGQYHVVRSRPIWGHAIVALLTVPVCPCSCTAWRTGRQTWRPDGSQRGGGEEGGAHSELTCSLAVHSQGPEAARPLCSTT